jgi:hypothetical protein
MTTSTSIAVLLGAVAGAMANAAPVSSETLPRAAGGTPTGPSAFFDRAGAVVHSVPPTSADGFFSDAVAGQFYEQRVADNFALSANTAINGVNWWGSSENFIGPSDLSNMASFTIEIFDGNFSSLYAETFLTADTNAVETGAANSSGGLQYFHSVKLSSPVELLGGTEYWISIGATNVDPEGDAWVWSDAEGDAIIAADFFDGAGFQVFGDSGDVAFELQAIPAPGGAALLGLAGLVCMRRRR